MSGERASVDAPEGAEPEDHRPMSQLEAVVMTAAAMGRIDETNIRRAAEALRGKAD